MAEPTTITVKHVDTEVTIQTNWDSDIHTITSSLVGALVAVGFPYQVIMMGMKELVDIEINDNSANISTTYNKAG